jgi:hypothetical protein
VRLLGVRMAAFDDERGIDDAEPPAASPQLALPLSES